LNRSEDVLVLVEQQEYFLAVGHFSSSYATALHWLLYYLDIIKQYLLDLLKTNPYNEVLS